MSSFEHRVRSFSIPQWFDFEEGHEPEMNPMFHYIGVCAFVGAMTFMAWTLGGDISFVQPAESVASSETPVVPAVEPTANVGEIYMALNSRIEEFSALKEFAVVNNVNHVEVSFSSAEIYELGKAKLVPEGKSTLRQLARAITPGSVIQFEGYTDNIPVVKNAWLYPTNWELSGARAASVLREFAKQGHKTENLRLVAYGEARPMVPNMDEEGRYLPENQAKNRRIIIRVGKFQ
jgi:flagellar motor protein MotB